jgi:hypothetical protein
MPVTSTEAEKFTISGKARFDENRWDLNLNVENVRRLKIPDLKQCHVRPCNDKFENWLIQILPY